MMDKVDFEWRGSRFCGRGSRLGNQPQVLPLGEFFRKVCQDVGEDFAFAALRTPDAGQPNPLLGLYGFSSVIRAQGGRGNESCEG